MQRWLVVVGTLACLAYAAPAPIARERAAASPVPAPRIPDRTQPSGIALSSEPAGAHVFIDGRDTGRITPARLTDLAPGSHAIELRAEGYEPWTAPIEVPSNIVLELPVAQLRAPRGPEAKPYRSGREVKGAHLAKLLARFADHADERQHVQVTEAVSAAPRLNTRLEQLAARGALVAFELVQADDSRLASGGPAFGATVDRGRILFTAEFLRRQFPRPRGSVRVIRWNDPVVPDNLVFVLGHLAQHVEEPFDPQPKPSSKDEYIAARMQDEASAYVRGWNDLLDAASDTKGGALRLDECRAMLGNFRYRAVFETEGVSKLLGTACEIKPSAANIRLIGEALRGLERSDFN